VLDLFDDNEVDDGLFPSKNYPSDHIAIAADFIVKSADDTKSNHPKIQ
jgi:hypothetical protein